MKLILEERTKSLNQKAEEVRTNQPKRRVSARHRSRSSLHEIINTKEKAAIFMKLLESA